MKYLVALWLCCVSFCLVASDPLAAPTLILPTGSGNPAVPTFTWSADEATGYEIWISDVTTGQSPLIDVSVTDTTFTPATPLPLGDSFTFWVRGQDASGNGPWSAGQNFATGTGPAAAPTGVPTLLFPLGSNNPSTPTISWTDVTDATFFDVWVDCVTTNTSQVFRNTDVTGTSLVLTTALGDNLSYAVWVRAGNVFGFGGWSAAQDFGVGNAPAAAPTGVPTLTGPLGSNNPSLPTISWTDVTDATFFDVWIDCVTTNTSQVFRNTDVTGTSLVLTTALADPASYRAWVRAGNVFGFGGWSAAQDFGVGNAPTAAPTGVPTLTGPLGSNNPSTPTISWTDVTDATFFDVWVDCVTTNTSQVFRNADVTGTSLVLTTALADPASYRAWVRAGNVFGFGGWSAAQDFGVGNAPTAAPTGVPTLTGPLGSNNPSLPTISWTDVADATFFDVWIDCVTTNTSQVFRNTDATGTSLVLTTALADPASYRAWVRAGNVFGFGGWSAAQDFGVGNAPAAAPTGVPTLTGPLGSNNPSLPTISWTDVTDATFFDVWIDCVTTNTSQVFRNTDVTGTSLVLTTALADNLSYAVWVRAGNVFGFGGWSAAQDFGVGNAPTAAPTDAPNFISPAGILNIPAPLFSWAAVANAGYYDLWVDDETTGTSQVLRQQQIFGTTFTPATPLPAHAFTAWLRASNVFGSGPWSAAQDFAVSVPTPPTIAAVSADGLNPDASTGTSALLDVEATDSNNAGALAYAWTLLAGPASVTYDDCANQSATAYFSMAGHYTFQATVTNGLGLSTTGTVIVTIAQNLASVTLAPETATLNPGSTQDFFAMALDQFQIAMDPQPSFNWNATGGTIDSTGAYSADVTGGLFSVSAGSGGISASAQVILDSVSAEGQSLGTLINTPLDIALSASALSGAELEYTFTDPANGYLSGDAPVFVYTPFPGFVGTDSFTFMAACDTSASNFVTINIAITDSPPVLVQGATADGNNPDNTAGIGAALAVSATPCGGGGGANNTLLYSWTETSGMPQSAYSLSDNNSATALNTVAVYAQAGSYSFSVTITDEANLSISSSVMVNVAQSAVVSPGNAGIALGGTQIFTLTGQDQFNHSLSVPSLTGPNVSWAVEGGGSISSTGVLTAQATAGGPFTVSVLIDGAPPVSGTASFSVVDSAANIIALAGGLNPYTTGASSVQLSLQGADPANPNLIYSWTENSGLAAFSDNNTLTAQSTTASFTQPGNYLFSVAVTDGAGFNVSGSVQVTVLQAAALSPSGATVSPGGTQEFFITDQFGNEIANVTWSVNGGGSVDGNGVFTAQDTPGGPFTLNVSGNAHASASIYVDDPAIAADQSIATTVNTPAGITLSASSASGAGLTFRIVDAPLSGSLTGTAPNLTYTPNTNFGGTDSFTFVANDGVLDSNLATVGIAINPPAVPRAPVIVNAASADGQNPDTTGGIGASLSVLATDSGGDNLLVYSWAETTGMPVLFNDNNSNSAQNTSVFFGGIGSYFLTVTATNGANLSVSSSVAVYVVQSAGISPGSAEIVPNGTQQFSLTGFDQFENTFVPVGAVSWSVNGGGSVDNSGLVTAQGTPGGPYTLSVLSGGIAAGTAGFSLADNTANVIALADGENPDTTGAASAQLSVEGVDATNPNLIFVWSDNSGTIAFSDNNTYTAQNATAFLTQIGTYSLNVAITDGAGVNLSASVTVTARPVATALAVVPGAANIEYNTPFSFLFYGLDQFNNPLAFTSPVAWTLSDPNAGSIGNSGNYVSGSVAGNYTVTVSSGAFSGASAVTVGDFTAPVFGAIVPADGATIPGPGLAGTALTVNYSDAGFNASGVDLSATVYELDFNGTVIDPSAYFVVSTPTAITFTFPNSMSEGNYTINVSIQDLAGNGPVSSVTGFIADSTPPVIVTTPGALRDDTPVSTFTATITDGGSGVDLSTLLVFVDGVAVNSPSPYPLPNGGEGITVALGAPSSTAVFEVRVSDLAGNQADAISAPALSHFAYEDGAGNWNEVSPPDFTFIFASGTTRNFRAAYAPGTDPSTFTLLAGESSASRSAGAGSRAGGTHGGGGGPPPPPPPSTGPFDVAYPAADSQYVYFNLDDVLTAAPVPLVFVIHDTGLTSHAYLFNGSVAYNMDPASAGPSVAMAPSAVLDAGNVSVSLSVLGSDAGLEPNLTYVWSVAGTPPAQVNFGSTNNLGNAGKNTDSALSKAGTYQFVVTVSNPAGQSNAFSVFLDVPQVASQAALTPQNPSVDPGNSVQLTYAIADQFGDALASPPPAQWQIAPSGGAIGSIGSNGLFTADPASTSGSFQITAGSGDMSVQTTLTLMNSGLSVTLDLPASGATVNGVQDLLLSATATVANPLGKIKKVEFYGGNVGSALFVELGFTTGNLNLGQTKLGEARVPPYQMTWRDVAPGNYYFYAVATDENGFTAVSGNSMYKVYYCVTPLDNYDWDAYANATSEFLAIGLNNTGQVLYQDNGFFFYLDGVPQYFTPTPLSPAIYPPKLLSSFLSIYSSSSINDSGVVIGVQSGNACIGLGGMGATKLERIGAIVVNGVLQYGNIPLALNNSGQVVGYYYDFSSIPPNYKAVTWINNRAVPLGGLGGNNTFATGINNAGQIIGNAQLPDGTYHPVVWENLKITDLSPLAANGVVVGLHDLNVAGTVEVDLGQLVGINNRGEILGNTYLSSTTYPKNVVVISKDSKGVWRQRIVGQGSARSINDSGEIVGLTGYKPADSAYSYFTAGDILADGSPVLWKDWGTTAPVDVTSLIPPDKMLAFGSVQPGAPPVYVPVGIVKNNNAGTILCYTNIGVSAPLTYFLLTLKPTAPQGPLVSKVTLDVADLPDADKMKSPGRIVSANVQIDSTTIAPPDGAVLITRTDVQPRSVLSAAGAKAYFTQNGAGRVRVFSFDAGGPHEVMKAGFQQSDNIAAGILAGTQYYIVGAEAGASTFSLVVANNGNACGDCVALNVIKMGFVVPDANGNPTQTEFVAGSDPRPTVTFDQIPMPGDITLSNGMAHITITGIVRDAISEIVHDNVADVTTINVFSKSQFISEIQMTRVDEPARFFAPHANHMKFIADFDFPCDETGTTLSFVTGANGFGNTGTATINISANQSTPVSDGIIIPNPIPANGQLTVISVSQGYNTDPGPFTPTAIRVQGDDTVLTGSTGLIGTNQYPVIKRDDGSFWFTGSTVRILMYKRSLPGLTPDAPLIIDNYVINAVVTVRGAAGKLLPGQKEADMEVTDLLAGQKNANITISIPDFTFKPDDSFTITGVNNDVELTGIHVAPGDKSKLIGTLPIIDPVELPPGNYEIKLETNGGKRLAKIQSAITINKPVHLIIANQYGDNPKNDPVGQALDDALVGSAVTLRDQTYTNKNERVMVLYVGTPVGALKPALGILSSKDKKTYLASWSDLGAYLRSMDVKPGTVIGIDTLGHGTQTGPKVKLSGALKITAQGTTQAGPANYEVTVQTGGPKDAEPLLSDEKFANYFAEFLADGQDVKIILWHCFIGDGNQSPLGNGAKRLAKALNAVNKKNITIHAWTDEVNFDINKVTNGKLQYDVPKGSGVHVIEESK